MKENSRKGSFAKTATAPRARSSTTTSWTSNQWSRTLWSLSAVLWFTRSGYRSQLLVLFRSLWCSRHLLHSFGLAFPLWLLRAGSGYRVPTVCRRHAREPVRAFNGYLVFTKPESECYGARRTSWLLKCPFWMSSTHWGRRATVCAERTVSGCIWATGATSECGRMRLLSSLGKEEIKAKSEQ